MKIFISGVSFIIGLTIVASLYTFHSYKKTRSQYVWNRPTNWLFNTGNSITRYYLAFINYLKVLFSNDEELEIA